MPSFVRSLAILSIIGCGGTSLPTAVVSDTDLVSLQPLPDPPAEPPVSIQLAAPAVEAEVEQPTDTPVRAWLSHADATFIGVRFSDVMVDSLSAPTPEINVEAPLTGAWHWTDNKNLRYEWADGAVLPPGTTYTVTVDHNRLPDGSATLRNTTPYFVFEGKVARWAVIPGQPRFVGFLNAFSLAIGDGPMLLLYDQPVDPSLLSRQIRVADNKDLQFDTRVSLAQDLSHITDADVPTGHVVEVQVLDLPKDGEVYASVPTFGGSEQWSLDVKRGLTVDASTLMDRHWDAVEPDRLPKSVKWTLATDRPVSTQAAQEAFQMNPQPESVQITAWDGRISVQLGLALGTEYEATFDGLKDALGNTQAVAYHETFRTEDHPPMVRVPKMPIAVEQGRGAVEVRVRNVEGLAASATPVAADDFAQYLASGNGCGQVSGVRIELQVPAREAALNVVDVVSIPVPEKPGLWCITVSADGVGTEADGAVDAGVLVQASDLGLTAKVMDGQVFGWMTQLSSPTPVLDGRLEIRDAKGRMLAEGRSEADGTVRLELPSAHGYGLEDAHVLMGHHDGSSVAVLLRDDRMSASWQFGLKAPGKGAGVLAASVFTERGAYRPGDDVQISVVGGVAMAGNKASVAVMDARGQEAHRQTVVLDRFGVGTIEVPTAERAAVGIWRVEVSSASQVQRHSFRVEEYRVPTFEVVLSSDAEWKIQEGTQVVVDGHYLHGGTLDGRAVSWEVRREAAAFTPAGFDRYQFDVQGGPSVAGTVASGKERLNGTGKLAVAFTPNHASSAGPVRYTVDATVTDVDRQAYLGRTSQIVHPADFYLGVQRPLRQVFATGDVLEVPVVAVSHAGSVVTDIPVRMQLERVDHHSTTRMGSRSAQTLSRAVDVVDDQCLVRTTAAGVRCVFTIPRAGQWRVRAWSSDAKKRDVQAGFSFRATGSGTAAWPRFDHERIGLTADKRSYVPGEVATLVVETPFDEAEGLLTIEREGILTHQRIVIRKDTPAIKVPITGDYAPNVYATVSLLRGRMHNQVDASGFPTGAPAFRLGTVELKVALDAQTLAVNVSPDRNIAAPGERLTVDVGLADVHGRPVTGQAVVMVVDEAVLGLTAMKTPQPLAALYPDQALGVRTADSRLELPHARRARHEVLFPGGDGGFVEGQIPANLLRSLFESTAFFDAQVPVKDGKGRVSFDLPDNTTRYRVMVVAVDEDGRAGASDANVAVRLPLMVQAVTPRFVYPNDSLHIEALVHNGTEIDADVTVTGAFDGFEGTLEETVVHVPAGGTGKVAVEVRVTGHDEAKVTFMGQWGEHADAVTVSLPVLEPGVARTQVVSTAVVGKKALQIDLPDDRVRGTETLELVASTTSLTELQDAVGYLMGYPNGCIEQTTSRAYPLVVLEDLLPEIGVEVDREKLREYSEAGVARILSFQTNGGGLSYWPGGTEPHAFATSFGLTALIEAKKRGYDVPDESLSKMGDYLVDALSRGDITEQIPHGRIADGDTRALFVMTLGRLDRPQPAWIERLWTEQQKLTPFGLSFLAISAAEISEDHPLLPTILAEIERRAETDEDEAWYGGTARGGYSMDSPLRSHAAALLASSKGDGDLTGKYLKGLLKRRQRGLWGNTQENVFGIMAIVSLSERGGTGGRPGLNLARNGQDVNIDGMEKTSERVLRQTWGPEDLDASRQQVMASFQGGSPVNLTLRATYDVQLNAENSAPTSSGARISRTYTTVDGQPVNGVIPLGSLVLVTLTVETDAKLNYVAVDDKLPAGLEPLNTDLVTTERVSMGALTPELEAGLKVLSYREIRDHRVAFYADDLKPGIHAWRYVARATTLGTFLRPAARVEAMYDPSVFASSAIESVVVE